MRKSVASRPPGSPTADSRKHAPTDNPGGSFPATLHQQETERLSAIIATQQIIATSSLDRDSLMNLIVERVQALTQAGGAAFELREGEQMVYQACCGNTTPYLGLRLNIHTSLSGQCVLAGRMLRCDDSETDARVDREACRRVSARSMIVVPLHYGQTVVGALKVLSPQPRFFTDRDMQTLQLMAGLFGAVVNQASEFDAQKEALRQSERQHRMFFETTTQGILYMNADGIITAANPAAERFLGVSAEQLCGRNAKDSRWQALREDGSLCPAEETPSLLALRTGKIGRGQVVGIYHPQQQTHRWMRVDSIPQFREGETQPYQVYSLFTDITAQKEAEAQRRQHQREMEALNVSLQRAMTETHHRVKNSLQVLLAMMDLDLMDKLETVPASSLERLSANVRSLALVHDILTQHSKTDWQNNTLSTRTVLSKLLGLLRETVCPRLRGNHIAEMALSLGRGTALALLTNELVQNAVKHGNGTVDVALLEEDGQLRFIVSDEGKGFPMGFDPRKAARTGLELVLTLARHDLGGDIVFENRPEGGARVVVTFPGQSSSSAFFPRAC